MRSLIVNFPEHCNGYGHAYRGIEISVEVYKFPLASAFFSFIINDITEGCFDFSLHKTEHAVNVNKCSKQQTTLLKF